MMRSSPGCALVRMLKRIDQCQDGERRHLDIQMFPGSAALLRLAQLFDQLFLRIAANDLLIRNQIGFSRT